MNQKTKLLKETILNDLNSSDILYKKGFHAQSIYLLQQAYEKTTKLILNEPWINDLFKRDDKKYGHTFKNIVNGYYDKIKCDKIFEIVGGLKVLNLKKEVDDDIIKYKYGIYSTHFSELQDTLYKFDMIIAEENGYTIGDGIKFIEEDNNGTIYKLVYDLYNHVAQLLNESCFIDINENEATNKNNVVYTVDIIHSFDYDDHTFLPYKIKLEENINKKKIKERIKKSIIFYALFLISRLLSVYNTYCRYSYEEIYQLNFTKSLFENRAMRFVLSDLINIFINKYDSLHMDFLD